MHAVDDGFDPGTLLALSEAVYFPSGSPVVDPRRIPSPVAAKCAARELEKLFDAAGLRRTCTSLRRSRC